MESFYEGCGYIATFLGTLLEGELSLITSMLGAKMGYYNVGIAMGFAFAGAWVADWFKFLIGKTKGKALLEKKPKILLKVDKATTWFESHPYLILTFYKFFLGTTTVILLLAGLKNVSYLRFAIHSGISVLLWVLVIGGLGYHCADLLIKNIELFSMHKLKVLSALALLIFIYWFFVKRSFRSYSMNASRIESD
tara:strand:- start:2765 stop:3346 length:582 start_codon:yes stop_codon:yes gene_type:complete